MTDPVNVVPISAREFDGFAMLTVSDGTVYAIRAADDAGARFLAAAHQIEIRRKGETL